METETLIPLQLTTHFHIREWKCKDGTEVPPELICNVQRIAAQLQILRDHLKEPIHITSGYRTPAYNKRIGGATKSQHTLGTAADITVKSKSPKQLKAIVEKLIEQKKMAIGGIGLYPGFLHLDVRKVKARW